MTHPNHKQNAISLIDVVQKHPEAVDAPITAQLAVAEAVLALAEQQRIANLIAIGNFRVHHRNDGYVYIGDNPLRPDIEALLETPKEDS